MRQPDIREGILVTDQLMNAPPIMVEVWIDPTDLPYDGDFPEDAEGCEGWDILVRATLEVAGQRWEGLDSLGSIWIRPGDKYLDECIADCKIQALRELRRAVVADAYGRCVKEADKRLVVAQHVMGDDEERG